VVAVDLHQVKQLFAPLDAVRGPRNLLRVLAAIEVALHDVRRALVAEQVLTG